MNDNKETVRRLMERLDQRDVDGVVSYCAPDCVWHGFAPEPLDNDGYSAAIAMFLDAYGNSRFPLDAVVAEGDTVAVAHRLVGTHRRVPGRAAHRQAGQRPSDRRLQADLLGMLMQIGAIPVPSGA